MQVSDVETYEEYEEEEELLEQDFDVEKGRRSLASLFDSDEEDVIKADASVQDESLLVSLCVIQALLCTREIAGRSIMDIPL